MPQLSRAVRGALIGVALALALTLTRPWLTDGVVAFPPGPLDDALVGLAAAAVALSAALPWPSTPRRVLWPTVLVALVAAVLDLSVAWSTPDIDSGLPATVAPTLTVWAWIRVTGLAAALAVTASRHPTALALTAVLAVGCVPLALLRMKTVSARSAQLCQMVHGAWPEARFVQAARTSGAAHVFIEPQGDAITAMHRAVGFYRPYCRVLRRPDGTVGGPRTRLLD